MLSHYVSVGVEELDQEKLTPLLRLKYHNSIADAVADLGKAGRDREGLRGLPEVSVRRAREGSHSLRPAEQGAPLDGPPGTRTVEVEVHSRFGSGKNQVLALLAPGTPQR